MAGERQNWYPYFNPCGGQIAEGWVVRRCFERCQRGGANCLPGKAFQMVGYIIEGSSLPQERRDFEPYLKEKMGRDMVQIDGTVVTLAAENFDEMLEATTGRASDILNAMTVSIEHTLPIMDVLKKCTPRQRGIMHRFEELNQSAKGRLVAKEQVEQFIADMQGVLSEAIDHDLDESGLITRQALAHGLGERVLAKRGIPLNNIPTQLGKLERS